MRLSREFRNRWRPPLSVVVALVLAIMLLVPLAGIFLFRVYENQLVQTTEAELIAQSAAIAAITAQRLREHGGEDLLLGTTAPAWSRPYAISPLSWPGRKSKSALPAAWTPQLPQLDLNKTSVLPARPEPRPTEHRVHPAHAQTGNAMQEILRDTQKLTLAGFRVLDANGTVIAGQSEIGESLSHVTEVKRALGGRYASVLRERTVKNPQPIYSISRGTSVRVFVALPVVLGGKVAGVVYASRTPSNILKEMFLKRETVFWVVLFVLGATFVVGFIFARAISGPIKALTARSLMIGKGDRAALQPLAMHGNREIHALSESMLDMSRKLFERNDYIDTFAKHVTHELKTPLTSIQGAAELMRDGGDSLSEAERTRFLDNILHDTDRASILLNRLRALAKADSVDIGGSCRLAKVIQDVRSRVEGVVLVVEDDCTLPLSEENARIVVENLVENSKQHDADRVCFQPRQTGKCLCLRVQDNGAGVSAGNAEKIFNLFFTTRRSSGGTGMGLGIIQALLRAHDATVSLVPAERGACFEIRFSNRPDYCQRALSRDA